MPKELPLILLPGMGADRRLFQAQAAAFENLITPDWIPPEPRDTLASYAARLAKAADPAGPCFVGGASFGGMVALELSRRVDARACFLIGSVRSPHELPARIRALRPLASIMPAWGGGVPGRLARAALAFGGRLLRPDSRSVLRQLADADGAFMRWAALALLRWEPSGEPCSVPVFQIHGDRDHVLPHRLTKPDVLLRGAGHLISVTFPKEVNEFLRWRMDAMSPR